MSVLLTGATGYIGSAVLRTLLAQGEVVHALVRTNEAADTVTRAGAKPILGDIRDVGWLTRQLNAVDGAIHAASPGDETSQAVDAAVASAVVAAYARTARPFVHTSGAWIYGTGSSIDESSPFDPPPLVAWRRDVESSILDTAVAATIVVPGVAYGYGGGIPALIAAAPRSADGRLTVLGDGAQHWTTVHVDDLAALYVLLLKNGASAGYVLGVSGVNPTVSELGRAADRGDVVPEGIDASRARLGATFVDALLLDQQASGAKARALGWTPSRPSLIDEFHHGSYSVSALLTR